MSNSGHSRRNPDRRQSSPAGRPRDARHDDTRARDVRDSDFRGPDRSARGRGYTRDARPTRSNSGPSYADDDHNAGRRERAGSYDGREMSGEGRRYAGARAGSRAGQAPHSRDEWEPARRDETHGWDDDTWREDGWDDDSAWDAPQRQRSRGSWRDKDWQPGGQGVAARGAAARRQASVGASAVGKRSGMLRGPLRLLRSPNGRIRITAIVMLVVIAVCALGSVPAGAFAYSSSMSLAKDGVASLKLAENDFKTLATRPTDLVVINTAQSHLQRAHDDFAQIQTRVTLLSPAALAPTIGSKVGAAVRLTPLAVEGTQAGILACDALKTLVTGMKNPLGTTGGLTTTDMNRIASDVDQIHTLFGQIAAQVSQLQPSDLTIDPRLGPLVAQVEQKLPQVTQLVNDLDGFAHALPQLLGIGKPSTYLVLVLDSSELRPTGGFIGNFGALTLSSGRLDPNFRVRDITLIDSSVKFGTALHQQVIQIPSQYAWLKTIFAAGSTDSWSLRDSNLDPDYPTTARYALDLYSKLLPDAQLNLQAQGSTLKLYNPQTSGPFVGVITLSLGFFQQALGVTGSIQVKDGPINETITAKNFVQRIHYYALSQAAGTGPDNQVCGDTSCAKVFTADVVKAFMAKVKANLSQYMGGLAKVFYDSLHTKDIEVYLTDAQAERLLSDLHVAATVRAPATGDSVFEVEANIGANKDNAFLKYQMADQISVDQSGAATHRLSWKYTWPNDPATFAESFPAGGPNYHSYAYHSYSRIFLPPNASLLRQSNLVGFGQLSASASTFNRKVFYGAAYANAVLGQSASYAVSWKTPGAVTHDSAGYHYHLLFQREAGIVWPLNLSIALPACAKLTGAPQTSGLTTADTYTMKGGTFTLTGPLTDDVQIQLDYAC